MASSPTSLASKFRDRQVLRPLLEALLWLPEKLWLVCRPFRRREILLCCNDPLMVDYLVPFTALFADDKRLKFHVVYLPGRHSKSAARSMQSAFAHLPEINRYIARLRVWDLVVCADHCFGNSRLRSPSIYIGHGAKSKTVPTTDVEYTYGPDAMDENNRPAYRVMLEDDERYAAAAITANPELRNIIKVVGHPDIDRLPTAAAQRDAFRAQLGFGPNDRVVFFLSTWGPHSLFQVMGEELLEKARQMQSTHRFILSTHSHEYRPLPPGNRVWGPYLESLTSDGFIVRTPREDWMPYLVASDCIVSDFCGLIEYAVRLQKPLVFTPTPDDLIWKPSLMWKARKSFPSISEATQLPAAIATAMTMPPSNDVPTPPSLTELSPGATETNIRRETYKLLDLPLPKTGQAGSLKPT